MKKLNILSLFIIMGLVSCAHRVKIMDVAGISMTKYSLKKGETLKEIKEVEGRFCPNSSLVGSIGLIDESVKNAQKESGADFLTNAVFYREGHCVVMTGTAMKIVK